jgi:chromosome partitioning protein
VATIRSARGLTGGRHVIAVGNLKGGTGKSTVSVNLACSLAKRGRSTIIVDNDPQGTATTWASQGRLPVSCLHRPLESFAQVEPWINTVQGLRARHDVVLIDLPASVAPALGASLLMASVILVPTSPSQIDLDATRRVLAHIRRARAERGNQPPAVFIVPDRVVDMERGLEGFADRLTRLGEPVAPPLRHSAIFDLAFEHGQWVGGFRPDSSAHAEVLALAELVEKQLDAMAPSPWPRPVPAGVSTLPPAAGARHGERPPLVAPVPPEPNGVARPGWLQRLFGRHRRMERVEAAG